MAVPGVATAAPLWVSLAWVGVRQDTAHGMWRDWIPPATLQCPGEPQVTLLCQSHLRDRRAGPDGCQSHLSLGRSV